MTTPWVLITGGNRGIGLAIVNELRRDNNIISTSRSEYTLDHAASVANNTFAKHFCCDSCSEEKVAHLAANLLKGYGPPQAIIHNAGITQDNLHIHQTIEQWKQVIETNLNSIFYWNKHLLPAMMLQGKGAILLISSVTGLKGNPGQTAYGASKAAMFGLARSLALEVARFGIRVNCLAPGVIDSDMTRSLSAEALKKLRAQIPLRRAGTPEEVAKVARFMISDDSQYMTGQTLILDGGMTA